MAHVGDAFPWMRKRGDSNYGLTALANFLVCLDICVTILLLCIHGGLEA